MSTVMIGVGRGHLSTEAGCIPSKLVTPESCLHGFHVHPVNSAPDAECYKQTGKIITYYDSVNEATVQSNYLVH